MENQGNYNEGNHSEQGDYSQEVLYDMYDTSHNDSYIPGYNGGYHFDNSGSSNGKKPKKKGKTGKKIVALVLSGILFGGTAGSVFLGISYLGLHNKSQSTQAKVGETTGSTLNSGSNTVSNVSTGQTTDVSEVAKNTMPTIVAITNKGVQEVQSFFGSYEQDSESSGSGIIVGENDTELLIATNNHVVSGSEDSTLSVLFVDDQVVTAVIKGTDASNDLAVIAVKLEDIPEETKQAIKIAQIGDSDALVVGEQVVAIGNALGYGQSVTTGIVSALDREVEGVPSKLIQTDAAINPGNSGGALLNSTGQVIGINSIKFVQQGVEGMGYAIPISTAQPIIEELMNQATREKVDEGQRGYLGISGRDVSSEVSQMYGMPVGIYVAEVSSGGASEVGGVKEGDIVTKIDKNGISTMEELKSKLQYYKEGETITLTVSRKGSEGYEEQDLQITLQGKPQTTQDNTQENRRVPNFGNMR